eukprot:CAMPEP_0168745360 /NCGR_PEP_ID=MMETSP0724-20121128/14572_1 /TAXON_ID=265536 /ORGANISM="Amphiprora sp., Strain CCMP467" /LENGTH=183 /DNA_ID=CAMNT_0008793059 /DNA_START=29 /DNA_END=580 /DNA_ORIENTATION=+
MTVTKPIEQLRGASSTTHSNIKRDVVVAKRSSSTFKFSAPSSTRNKSRVPKCNPDQGLQANNTQRRYLRRGSKCPSMFMLLSAKNMRELASTNLVDTTTSVDASVDASVTAHHHQRQRRMSLMTALKFSFEKTTIGDNNNSTSSPTSSTDGTSTTNPPSLQDCPMLNVEEHGRKSTYELLSQI